MVYICLAHGFEEMEAIAPVDILRRAGLEVGIVGVTGAEVTGAHGITIKTTIPVDQMEFENMEALLLPGGMPGTLNLEKSKEVQAAIRAVLERGRLLCAICAAPSILGHLGLLQGRRAVCFPGFEQELLGAELASEPVCRDRNLITARGAGVALEFGLAIAEALTGRENSEKIRAALQCIR